jgi:hypothetical protein
MQSNDRILRRRNNLVYLTQSSSENNLVALIDEEENIQSLGPQRQGLLEQLLETNGGFIPDLWLFAIARNDCILF